MLERIIESYRQALNRIFLVDYDGTIVPFTDDPEQAGMNDHEREVVTALASDPHNELVIISGRNRYFLEKQFENIPVMLIAEHGFLTRDMYGRWISSVNISGEWKKDVLDFFSELLPEVPGSFIEEKEASVVFHYRTSPVSDELLQRLKNQVHEFAEGRNGIEIMFGNHVIEIKISGFSKGTRALELINGEKHDFILAMGDDITDETLFTELKGRAFTIKVGDGNSCAEFRIKSPAQVINFLESLNL